MEAHSLLQSKEQKQLEEFLLHVCVHLHTHTHTQNKQLQKTEIL